MNTVMYMSQNTPTLTSYEESIAPWNDPIEELCPKETKEEEG